MPNIHGALIHVPTPKRGRFKQAGDAIKASPRARRAKHKATAALGNITSKPAGRPGIAGGKYGRPSREQRNVRREQRYTSTHAAVTGLGMGAGGVATAAVIGGAEGRHQQIARNQMSIKRNKKKITDFEKRSRTRLITDVGTKVPRIAEKVDWGHHPGKVGLAGIGVGAGATAPLAIKSRKKQKATLTRQNTTLTAQRGKLKELRSQQVNKSAFGVVH